MAPVFAFVLLLIRGGLAGERRRGVTMRKRLSRAPLPIVEHAERFRIPTAQALRVASRLQRLACRSSGMHPCSTKLSRTVSVWERLEITQAISSRAAGFAEALMSTSLVTTPASTRRLWLGRISLRFFIVRASLQTTSASLRSASKPATRESTSTTPASSRRHLASSRRAALENT
eukprot:scaffold965_cov262-Pinguiococcus_pyrenoidosus.AAC.7